MLAPDSPLDPMPQMSIDWPDTLELPDIEPFPAEADVQFAELDQAFEPGLTDPVLVRPNPQLVLAFPSGTAAFPLRDAFVDRFEALSTIEAYDDEDANVGQLANRARRDEELLGTLLRIYGYYDGQVYRTTGSVAGAAQGDRPQVRFDVVPGPRYALGAIDLGALASAPDYQTLRAAYEIEPGDPVSSDRIVEERFDLDTALGEFGYPFAEIDAPSLVVDHARQEADLTLAVRPNGKYLFGGVNSDSAGLLPGDHLAGIARFDAGDVYQRSLELDLRRAISATGLVSSVAITPREVRAPTAAEPGIVEMDVALTAAELRTVAGAVGYGSEEGVRIQASWEHRNLFPPEGLLRVRGVAGTQEQLAGVTFRKNNFGGRDKVLTADAFVSTIDSPAFDANTASVIVTYERLSNLLFQKPLSYSAGLELVATDERPAPVAGISRPRQTYFVAALPAFAQIDASDDLLDPTEGWRVSLRLSPEVSRNRGTQSFYLRNRIDGSYYRRVGDRTVLAARGALATIPGTALQNIAPSRRLYGGGGGSVRGYGFRQIGPRNAFGEPSGGRSLVEGAIEARIRTGLFDGAVSVVPFVDAGSVSTGVTPDFGEIKVGAGLGVRYETGFGPIRVDVGVPFQPGPDDGPVAVYVSLGQAF